MNVFDLFSLKGKVAIVTGGCGHLGKAMVDSLYEAGATVYVAGTSKEKYIERYGSDNPCKFVEIDILSSKSISTAFRKVFEDAGRIDVLVNDAAYVESGGKIPEEITDENWAGTQEGVMGSVFKCIREVLPYMNNNGGSIVNIASMYGVISPNLSMYEDVCAPYLNPIDYGAGKAAVIQMTKYFGAYLIDRNIRVNCITPGTYPNPEIQKNKEFVRRLEEKNPAHRLGQPEDLKGAVLYLASDASKYVVGQNICVDGGWTIW